MRTTLRPLAARAARVLALALAITIAGGVERALAAPPGAPVVIRTNPPGAAVILDGEVIGRTPWSGFLEDGGYELVISVDGYEPFATSLLATGAPVVIETALVAHGAARHAGAAPPFAAPRTRALGEPAAPAPALRGVEVATRVPATAAPYPGLALALTIALPLAGVAASSVIWRYGDFWIGVGLASASLALLPSAGHAYLKSWPKALAHAGLRVVAGGAIAGGTVLMATGIWVFGSPLVFGTGAAVTGLSALAVVGSIVYESVEVWRDARSIRRARTVARPVVGLAPLVATPWGAGPGATVMLSGF